MSENTQRREGPKTFIDAAKEYNTPKGRNVLSEAAKFIADYYDIPRPIFYSLINHESKWNPLATSPGSGAVGLGGKLLNNPTAVKYLGEPNGGPQDPRWDPSVSMHLVARLLREGYEQHGTWDDAILSIGNNSPEYLDKIKANIVELEKEPKQTSGIFGNVWSGVKESAGRSLGKLAAASQTVADMHSDDMFFEEPPIMGREETIARYTPAYSPPKTTAESIARLGGNIVGSIPEFAFLSTLFTPFTAPIATAAPLTTSVLRNVLPAVAQTATEPGATLKDAGLVGGATTGLSLALNLPQWYYRLPTIAAISLGHSTLSDLLADKPANSPESSPQVPWDKPMPWDKPKTERLR